MKHTSQPDASVTRLASTLARPNASTSRRLTLLGVGALLAMSAMAQAPGTARESQAVPVPARLPTLACCKCLGGVSTLDLSTTATSAWRVNGSPAVPTAAQHSAWDGLPPAVWMGPTANAHQDNLPSGVSRYTLKFKVPACEIGGPVTISGQMLGDDEVKVRLMKGTSQVGAVFSTPSGAPSPGWGFKIGKVTNFSYSLPGAGTYTLTVDVSNMGASPTGLVVKATASRRCGKNIGQIDPPHDDKP